MSFILSDVCFFLNILILGHSFVHRHRDDLAARFDTCAAPNFHLPELGQVSLFGTSGRTVEKLNKCDLSSLHKYRPDIVILEIGTNDLSTLRPEVVGSQIDDLVHVLREQNKVRVVAVCQVINRNTPQKSPNCHFNAKAAVLCQYLSVVLANQPGIFLWEHKEFYRPDRSFFMLRRRALYCKRAVSFIQELSWSYFESSYPVVTIIFISL